MREVVAPLPERAAVWGSLFYGLDAGDRTDLVQFQQAFNPALDYRAAARSSIVPDFLVLGNYELPDAAALNLIGQDSALRNFFLIFPGVRYEAVKLVSAPPYGTTVVYRRVHQPANHDAAPAIAVNDGTGRQWSSRVSTPLPVAFRPADDVSIDMSHHAIHGTRRRS